MVHRPKLSFMKSESIESGKKIRDIPCQNIDGGCKNKRGNVVIYQCDVCEEKHQHIKCSICGREWIEWI
jgi:RecJ-like exonuclease